MRHKHKPTETRNQPRLWMLGLLLLTSVSFSTGCSATATPRPDPCLWVQPINFQPTTKEWLAGQEWPETAYADFEKIAKHNDKVKAICQ